MKHLANKVNNVDEIVQYLKDVKAEFILHAAEVNGRLHVCQQQCQLTSTEHLQATRNNLMNLVCEAGSFCNVSRAKVRKYLKYCMNSAVHRGSADLAFGIFSPGAIADILEALVGHKYFYDNTSLALLRKSLPSALVEVPHGHPAEKPCNNEAQRDSATCHSSSCSRLLDVCACVCMRVRV